MKAKFTKIERLHPGDENPEPSWVYLNLEDVVYFEPNWSGTECQVHLKHPDAWQFRISENEFARLQEEGYIEMQGEA